MHGAQSLHGKTHALVTSNHHLKSPCTHNQRQPSRSLCKSSSIPPTTPSTTSYNDTTTDLMFIALCRVAYGNLAGWQSTREWTSGQETYAGMVEVSRALMRKHPSPSDQRNAVIKGFPEVPEWFRKVFPYRCVAGGCAILGCFSYTPPPTPSHSKWGAELNAQITPAFFTWLVGPMTTVDIVADDGRTQHSGVHIERCRYLAESNCVGMCVNLCKLPVQTFFTEELGMPLTMEPDFEDYSCRYVGYMKSGGMRLVLSHNNV